MKNKLIEKDLITIRKLFDSFSDIINDFEKVYLNYDYKKYVKKEDLKLLKEYKKSSDLLAKKIEDFFEKVEIEEEYMSHFTSQDHNLLYRILFAVNNNLTSKIGLIMLSNDDFANNIVKETEKNNTAVFNITEMMPK